MANTKKGYKRNVEGPLEKQVFTSEVVRGTKAAVSPTTSMMDRLPGPAFALEPELSHRDMVAKQDANPHWSPTGQTGLAQYNGYISEEWLTQLQGPSGIAAYEEMRVDQVLGPMLRVTKSFITNSSLKVEPANDTQEARDVADFVRGCYDDLENSWPDTLNDILSFLDFGFSVTSVWHKKRDGYKTSKRKSSKYRDGKIGWSGIQLIGHSSLDRWEINPDGEIMGLWQRPPNNSDHIYVPLTNAAHFRTSTEKNNPEGISVMRSAFEPYTFAKSLRRTEAIGVERDCAGIPVLQVKENASLDLWNEKDPNAAATLARCEQIVRLLRIDKYHGIVLPAQFELTILNSSGTRSVDADKIITRYENRCALALASDVLLLGCQEPGYSDPPVAGQSDPVMFGYGDPPMFG